MLDLNTLKKNYHIIIQAILRECKNTNPRTLELLYDTLCFAKRNIIRASSQSTLYDYLTLELYHIEEHIKSSPTARLDLERFAAIKKVILYEEIGRNENYFFILFIIRLSGALSFSLEERKAFIKNINNKLNLIK